MTISPSTDIMKIYNASETKLEPDPIPLLKNRLPCAAAEQEDYYLYTEENSSDAIPPSVQHVVVDPSVTTIKDEALTIFFKNWGQSSYQIPSHPLVGNKLSLVVRVLNRSHYQIPSHLLETWLSLRVQNSNRSSCQNPLRLWGESIKLPHSITSIGYLTFGGCSSLTSIELPDRLTSIGDGAFFQCYRLASIKFPDAVTSIGSTDFLECISLKSIELPDYFNSIESGAS